MLVGSAWEDITPERPLPLIGQGYLRMGEFTRDPLTVNALVLGEAAQRIVLLSIDLCFLPDTLVASIRQACAAVLGIAQEAVIIATTHTHVGPHTTKTEVGDVDPAFIARLEDEAVKSVQRALESVEDCSLFAGTGWLEEMGWNRRGMRRDGSCHMYWGSWKADFIGVEGPRDGEVGVIFARTPTGQVKTVICSFATHPNCVENDCYYSADLPGEVRRVLRAVLGSEVGVIYLTGAAGNTAPTMLENNPHNDRPWRGEEGLLRSGAYLGGEILKVIAGQIQPMASPLLCHEWKEIAIPMREWDVWADLSEHSPHHVNDYEQARADWPRLMAEENPVETRLHIIRLGDAAICCNPAELYVEFGLAIKQRSPARVTLIAELSDGYIGYVPTPEAIRHGGYSAMSGSNTRLAADAGWTIVETTELLLNAAFRNRKS